MIAALILALGLNYGEATEPCLMLLSRGGERVVTTGEVFEIQFTQEPYHHVVIAGQPGWIHRKHVRPAPVSEPF